MPQIELAALEHLSEVGSLTPGELGHRLGLTSGGVTALTGRLIDAGHVSSERHPADGRMRVLTITVAGTEWLVEQMEPIREPVEECLAALPFEHAELVTRVLDELAARREVAAEGTPGPERTYPTDGYTRALLM